MKYEAKLEDGALVAKSPEEGVEFCVNDGNFVQLGKKCISCQYHRGFNFLFKTT